MSELLPIAMLLGYVLIILGVAGSVIPVLPGPLLVWMGALVWAWGDGFVRIGWVTLVVLGILAVVAWGSDLFLSVVVSRRAGASWKSIGGAILFGVTGSLLLSGIPLLGTVLGAVLGAMFGMWLIEYWEKRDSSAAFESMRAYVSSVVVAALVEMTITVLMITIFAWQAFL